MTTLQFWEWFMENKKMIEDFISAPSADYTPYNTLSEKLSLYNKGVMPELTIDSRGNFILVLTCDGIRAGIGPVEELWESAPAIDKWVIQKFRAPGYVIDLNFKGLDTKAKDIKAKYRLNKGSIDIQIYMKGYTEEDPRYKNLGFLYLDHLVGEYLVMTKIGFIEFHKIGLFTKTSDMINLPELCELIKALV